MKNAEVCEVCGDSNTNYRSRFSKVSSVKACESEITEIHQTVVNKRP